MSSNGKSPKMRIHFDVGPPDHPPAMCSVRTPALLQTVSPKTEQHSRDREGSQTGQFPTWVHNSALLRKGRRPAAIHIPARDPFLPEFDRQVVGYEYGGARIDTRYTRALVSPVSPGSFPSLHRELEKYELEKGETVEAGFESQSDSDSFYSSACAGVSPTTFIGELASYAPGANQSVDNDMDQDNTEESDLSTGCDEISQLAAASAEFFPGLDVDALLDRETDYVLEDHDDLKGPPLQFDLRPHLEHSRCHCYFCYRSREAYQYGYESHDYDIWCSCLACRAWTLKKDRQQKDDIYCQTGCDPLCSQGGGESSPPKLGETSQKKSSGGLGRFFAKYTAASGSGTGIGTGSGSETGGDKPRGSLLDFIRSKM